ncbi:hypothetical protein L1887_54877 [Cichorium endivia]|nr:hypothetical protein L1887_54877 [Cichorium endivia]
MVGASTVRRVTILRKAPLPATLDPVEAWRETSWIGRQQHRAVTLAALHLCSHDRLVCLPFRLFGRHTPPDAPHDAEPCTSMCWPRLAVPDRVQRACGRGRGGPLELAAVCQSQVTLVAERCELLNAARSLSCNQGICSLPARPLLWANSVEKCAMAEGIKPSRVGTEVTTAALNVERVVAVDVVAEGFGPRSVEVTNIVHYGQVDRHFHRVSISLAR